MSFTKKGRSEKSYPVEERLGEIITDELWGVVPYALYKYQKVLGISIADVWFLAWIFMHQWNEKDAYPSLKALSRYTGVSRTYIQTIAHRLHARGLIIIKERSLESGGWASNFYDTSPLKTKLEEIIKGDKRSSYSNSKTTETEDSIG